VWMLKVQMGGIVHGTEWETADFVADRSPADLLRALESGREMTEVVQETTFANSPRRRSTSRTEFLLHGAAGRFSIPCISGGHDVGLLVPTGCGQTGRRCRCRQPACGIPVAASSGSTHRYTLITLESLSAVTSGVDVLISTWGLPLDRRQCLSLGRPERTQSEIEDAAKLAEAHYFILAPAAGIETRALARRLEATLRGGERPRLSSARRGCLKNAAILSPTTSTSPYYVGQRCSLSIRCFALY